MSNQPLYQNITISGLPGCGSTTLLKQLKETLSYDGWTGFSGGEFSRLFAIEKGYFDKNNSAHHSSSNLPDDFERQVDYGIREKLETQNKTIIESWLSGFMAQGVPGVLKVLMVCSSDEIRIDRIVNRDGISIAEAKQNTIDRYEKNLAKWQPLYSQEWQDRVDAQGLAQAGEPLDFWKPELYDLVIDTYSTPKQDTLNSVLHKLGLNPIATVDD